MTREKLSFAARLKKKEIWLSERPTLMVSLLPAAIALNLSLSWVVNLVKLPVFLDSVGTILLGALFGPGPGAIAGVLSNAVGSLTVNPVLVYYAGTAAVIGAAAGIASRRGWFRSWWKAAAAGLGLGIVAAVISAPVSAYVFGGVAPGGAYSLIVAWARAAGRELLEATVLAGLASDPVDKAVSFLICYSVLSALPRRLQQRFPATRTPSR